jgi:hypothetical protein
MNVPPVAALDLPPIASEPGRAPRDRQGFVAALAAASRDKPDRPSDPATDSADEREGDPLPSPIATSEPATPPIDAMLALLVAARPHPANTDLSASPVADPPNLSATAPVTPAAPPPANAPTVVDLAALVRAVAGDDVAGPPTLIVQSLPPSAAPSPAVELAFSAAVEDHSLPLGLIPEEAVPSAMPAAVAPTHSREPAAPAAVAPRQLIEQLAPRLVSRVEQSSEFRVSLRPESLGAIDVAVRVSPTGIHIVLTADERARDLLQAGLAELRSAVRPSDGREVAIEVAPRLGSSFDAGTAFGRGGSSWSAPASPSRRRPADEEPVAPASSALLVATSGQIDYRV